MVSNTSSFVASSFSLPSSRSTFFSCPIFSSSSSSFSSLIISSTRLFQRRRVYPHFSPPSIHTIVAISSNDIRPGTTIDIDGQVHKVLEFLHVKPGKGAAFVRSKLKNLTSGNTVEKTFRAGETLKPATLEKVTMQYSYREGDELCFMNMETFEEDRITEQVIGKDKVKFIYEGLDVEVLTYEGKVLDVDIPKTMSLTVVETDPGVKGNTVQGGNKPATLNTGAVINVPLFITTGEVIKVDTTTSTYLGRDNEAKK